MKKSTVYTRIILVIAILVMINLLSEKWYSRLDFTADKRYTLSISTRDILKDLHDVVTITAYFSENLPPQLAKTRKDFEDMLIEYENRSEGAIVHRFVDPGSDEVIEREAQQQGIRPVMVNVTQKDKASQMRAYMGAVLQMEEETEVIPFMSSNAGMEYELTTAIKKLSVSEKPKIAFLQGHGEPPMEASIQVLQQLEVLYDSEELTITDSMDIPSFYRSIAIIAPTDSFPDSHLDKLDRYLRSGGNLMITYSNLQPDLNQGFLSSLPPTSFEKWMEEKGWSFGSEYIVDAQSGSISVQQNMGGFILNSQKPFPYFPIIADFTAHPVTEGLDAVILPFVSPIHINVKDTAIHVKSIASTSDLSGLISSPAMVDIEKEWSRNDFQDGPQTVAIAAEGPLGGSGSARMVVVSNGNYSVNGIEEQRQGVSEDNVNLTSNIIDWLSDDTGLIYLRTKGVTARPLAQVDDSTRNMYKYGNVVAPVLLILGIGFFRRRSAARKRQKRMEGNF